MLLKNKTAVITGTNRGIGKALVNIFAKNGANIWACQRKESDEFLKFSNSIQEKYGVWVKPIYFDLSDEKQIVEKIKTIQKTKQSVDILVNNAGVIFTSLFQMTSLNKMRDVFNINYFSHMLLTQYISRLMVRQKSGSIINISSSAAIEGNEGRVAYASSKAALITSTKVLARELAAYNIRVNAVAPGLTKTEMMENSTPDKALVETLERICLKRVGDPEEIANSVLFLASDLSSYITSQVLRVDGGM